VVEELGAGVVDFKTGDAVYFTPEIFGNNNGTYAEFTCVPARIVAPKPKNLSHQEAAAVPLAGGTAWEAIVRRLKVQPAETVLIHGAAGGVGSFAVQIAKAMGARVLGTSGTSNLSVLRELGVDVPIDYSKEDFIEVATKETEGRGVDAVLDCFGGDLVGQSIRAIRPGGRIAHILSPGGDLMAGYSKNLTLHGIFLVRERTRLEEMRRLIEMGRLRPLVAQVLPLERVREAHERLDSGHGRGKIVLSVVES
jgi:NADPH2:quinone reductase